MVKLNAITAGTTLKFENKNWILLNPQTGFLLCTEGGNVGFESGLLSFSFSHLSVQGWFSNIYNGFYKKNLVEARAYNVGGYGGSYDVVMSPPQYIGTISAFDFYQYQSMLGTAVSNAWTTSFGVGGIFKTSGSGVSIGNHMSGTAWYYLYPTIYITPTTEVTNGEITGNTAPTYTQIPAQTVRKNTTATIALASYFSDAEGNSLTYTASSNNANIATVSVSGSTLTVTGKAIGSTSIIVTANDGSLSTSQTFNVTVANTAPTQIQIPAQTTKKGVSATVNLNNYFADIDNDVLTYTASSNNAGIATVSVTGSTLTVSGQAIGNTTINVTASDGRGGSIGQAFTLAVTNSAPTVSVVSPSANVTLYENDLLQLAGTASDTDLNQSITVYSQVNNEQRIVIAIGLSNMPVTFNKQLKFVGSKLYDGDTVITGNLTDGIPHVLKIWAQDSDGGQSTIAERSFYVVPNRPPILTIDTVQPNGIINTDKFKISGGASDPDGNDITAAYRINGGNSIALEIIEGKWAFDIALAQLVVGQNTIVIELMDSYDFKVSKTIKLNKNEVNTPILQSVARYKISPPKGSAKGVLMWIQRDVDLDLHVDLSMTLKGEQESYTSLTAMHTVPVYEGVVEDEFYYETQEPKDNIILKLTTTRPNVNINNKIYLIMGVLE